MNDMQHFPVPLPGAKADTWMWADPTQVEFAALDQLRNISALPWTKMLRVMPDVHLGKGATVGSVIAMRDAVAPNAVGVDIGCGMIAVRSSLTVEDLPDDLHPLRLAIEAAVPLGVQGYDGRAPALKGNQVLTKQFDGLFRRFGDLRADKIDNRHGRAMAQCGSLGGGNHFIEVCAGSDGRVWVTLHSGSRNIGKEIAERHAFVAKGLDHNKALPDKDLAVFLAGTPQMDAYRHDLYWAQDYAFLSRQIMLAAIMAVLRSQFDGVSFDEQINCHHNYVAEETYDGELLFVTRKGAIRAGTGDMGLIPGSMGTGSYVVRGLGSELSLNSASHGAGRRMSRSEAKRQFTADDLASQTLGIECRKDAGVVDEIPGAYKDIDDVIAAQTDLVEVVTRLSTLLCVKG
ncbi:MAG: RtcB family protein [Propionibacteriaceae bacterium]|nr:RtcB family protein [Propionibacteriaceae bacterium]